MSKAIWTLNPNDWAPDLTKLTYPLLKFWARKLSADFNIISTRKYPDWPITYEKLQLYELGRNYDWNIYIDSDAFVAPEMFDPTNHLTPDTVMHNSNDMAGLRWRYDEYFRRDGRNIGSCNWFAVASKDCLDLWRPLDDLTQGEALNNIFPICHELQSGITREHLIDDYVVSRNIAKYGLKFKRLIDVHRQDEKDGFFWHHYTIPVAEKIINIRRIIENKGIAILAGAGVGGKFSTHSAKE